MVTPLQIKVYDYIRQHLSKHSYSPSLTEIACGIGISPNSISLISRSIHALVAAGRLRFHKKGYRSIELANMHSIALPVLGRFSAGEPLEIMEIDTVDLHPIFKESDHFVVIAKGQTLIEEGIFEGDLMLFKQSLYAEENEMVLALIDQKEALLRRLSYKIQERITLIPANPNLKPKAYLTHRVQIKGVFVGLLRLKDFASIQ